MTRVRSSGLYDPAYDHDSCGFGLVANVEGRASRWLVEQGYAALAKMAHRGGVNGDGITGDGSGILIHRPTAWLRALAAEAGIAPAARFAAGLVFLDRDPERATAACACLDACLAAEGLVVAGWREVPVADAPCGPLGLAHRPRIRQVFADAPASFDEARFERALFRARRRAEAALADDATFYVVSLSAATIGYKAMAAPGRLEEVFPDLQRPDLAASCVVFHQRFSTNTMPNWKLAQPFRLLAHNGEINTIRANRSWAGARQARLRSALVDFSDLGPLVSSDGSDSQSLDNMLEVLLAGGIDLLAAMRILVPPAWNASDSIDEDLEAFYEYYALHSEPWDGPAGLVMCDGRYAACTLDRNGLRPARWTLADDGHLIVASETGLWDLPERRVVAKGRIGPGQMLAVDLTEHRLLDNAAIDAVNRTRAPFKQWLRESVTYLESYLIDPALAAEPFPPEMLARFQKQFALTREERDVVLKTLAEDEAEATGSMGDDTPAAVLSQKSRPLYEYFRQAFAQVTNPPIDPLRERLVMSLVTQIGLERNIFDPSPENARQVLLNSPVLSQRKLRQILALPQVADHHVKLDLYYDERIGLEAALKQLCADAEAAVRGGAVLVLLSDRYPAPGLLPVHALLATGAVHAHLIDRQLRCDCNLLVETGTARDAHHFACLIGFGATAVYPYLAYQTLFDMNRRGELRGLEGEAPSEIGRSYRRGIRKGLLKILSKMGISTIAGYRGAQLFEIVGLDREVVDLCFPGAPSRIGGAGFADIEAEYRVQLAAARDPNYALPPGGLLKAVPDGEYHMYNPAVVGNLQAAVRSGDAELYRRYADAVNGRPPSALRDLLAFREDLTALPDGEDVEPSDRILKRFDSAGMSLGALSPEAHEALAIAMNRLGARSNSGEGGEDPARYGTERMSKIKQVASGRFGVTPAYLVNAEVLQIKIAQGAKPGEGGQLPGHKVNPLIARLRYAKPGIGLISPPPHHDIYSIEDLAELIHDLREVNPRALVSVKLVSHAGVGTIAAGVVKAGADLVTVSGHDGGTGASPLTSIRYAGVPWELGLAETHQTLVVNGLRERVIVQTDGGLKTGLDVVKAAILGADSFGFGTGPMVALGCKFLRICHLNSCATGVATQNEVLRRKHFLGAPEMVENFFRFVADDVRAILAAIGAHSLGEIVGRTELLRQIDGVTAKQRRLDLSPLLARSALAESMQGACAAGPLVPGPGDLVEAIARDAAAAVAARSGTRLRYAVGNTDRAVGARLSGEVARTWGDAGMADAPVVVELDGAAGQSFGAWNAGGVHLVLHGEANDGVGKGMAGGRIVVRPPADVRYATQEASIIGNTCLYGATGGELYAAGRAGERFAVRNSGAIAVVEGVGDHGCEYMTGGTVVVLGRTGLNFGAGMTGGIAYVLDLERDFVDRYNHELIDIVRISLEGMENHMQHVRNLIRAHAQATDSVWAGRLLEDFRNMLHKVWLVKPKAASLDALAEELRRAA
ncbi:glutamate synthase large subunit [Dokdonella koreensis]|uniref:Glutamate synthase, large chain n=1 Tax=Dokdonella koreensis DS-123 TaxID=1300342 RepID=A0A160DUI2_9GAMM|nr:glutamate synthase large subunit [Dokdonella koreensis]ANB18138.1 Glutamate synthase, large chain [Dokdonella koreensis DS-123]